MVVLSPAFTALTALLALVGSSGVEAAYPLGHSSRLGKEPRKYLQPQGAAPARPFKPARPVWNRNSDVAGTGEQRFAARNKYRAHRANHQKRSDIDNVCRAVKCSNITLEKTITDPLFRIPVLQLQAR